VKEKKKKKEEKANVKNFGGKNRFAIKLKMAFYALLFCYPVTVQHYANKHRRSTVRSASKFRTAFH
jgi:hypothetical protein